ncbi:MAG: hypothetical protein EBT18_11760, partial [Gammaproteobacteria bacterium]|nr:hypothetical protein [Gammaproteobacteria bacterium]
RRALLFVNRTLGEATELMDLWQVVGQNIYVRGKRLTDYDDPSAVLLNANPAAITVDFEQMLIDYAAMEAMDRGIGKLQKGQRQALNDLGYWGPNIGSYLPDVPPGT